MPKIDITKAELVWPDKYSEDGALKQFPKSTCHSSSQGHQRNPRGP